ncbi:MAG: DUF1549 and DUF1553 domain-containing protein [Pirellulaceae bacterium]|nr:DUF1549 and DUF1553 domain-containing protein [Pirellulaceae bacterium]
MKTILGGLAAMAALCMGTLASAQTAEKPIEFPGLGPAGALTKVQIESAGNPRLHGRDARRQLLVTGVYASGQLHDLTHRAKYSTNPANIVQVDADGFVTPLADGKAVVRVEVDGKTAEASLEVANIASEKPINFSNQIVPIFTKLGCNTGSCHGKMTGQNGFKLSLLGFYPKEDHEFVVKENRGRRIFPASPEFSLLLQKPANQLPHGGGHRLDPGTYEWKLITRWIEQGMPYGDEDDPVVDRIEVFPKSSTMNRDSNQQVSVVAHYSDGSVEDVTRIASYGSNDVEMADASASGRITVFDTPGDVAVMIRFQSHVGVFRAEIPQGLPVENTPPAKNFIDQLVFAKLKKLGIPPSELCDDATFIRRATIDVAGRLPTADEVSRFLADKDAAKRAKWIDFLLDSPAYGYYFANKWSNVLRNQRANTQDIPFTYRFHDWIRASMQENMPYDEFVRSILTATGDVERHPPVAWYKTVNTSTSQMEDTAQLFLGLRIQCARCHHHPFERWSQDDYYGFMAFFSRVGRKPGRTGTNNARIVHNVGVASARNPRSQQNVTPRGLGGEPLEIPAYADPREAMVDWMADPQNPFFARALTNRYWKHFLGRGIVSPEDDLRVTNPPSNPELLDALAKHFVDSKFDLKDLVRTICNSSTYQLSSEPTPYNINDVQNHSSFYPRRLNAEVLYDAINQVALAEVRFSGMPAGTKAIQLPDNGFDDYFLTVFGKPQAQSACECERSADANLAQSLHLLNSTDIHSKLSNGNGRAAQLVKDDKSSIDQKIDNLYLWAFARRPRPNEVELITRHVKNSTDQRRAFEDVLWALFNTKEFLFNR